MFEFAGAGTDYRAHPDNGGNPVEANQVKNEGAGKVYISSSDHNGNFKVGDVFSVSTDGESVTAQGDLSVSGTSTLTGDVTAGGNITAGGNVTADGNVTVGGTLDVQTLTINGGSVNTSGTYFDSSGDILDTAMPDKITAGTSTYPDSVTVDAQGRVTAISAGTEPVTAVTAASGSAVSVTATKTPEVDIATFAGSSQKGIVVNDGTAGNDSKYLKGDGTWADVTTSVGLSAAADGSNANLVLERTAGNDTVKFAAGTGIDITVSGSSGSEQILIEAPTRVNAQIHISDTVPTSGVAHGDLYFDFATGESYLYYDESLAIDSSTSQAVGSDAQWIQFAPQQRGTGNGTVTSIQVTGGTGLSVDNASAVVTSGSYEVSLDDTAVTIGTYGNANTVAQFTVDQQGRITSATDVTIDLDAAAVSSGEFDLARIPTLTVDKIPTLTVDKIPTLTVEKIPQFNAEKIQYTNSGTETNAWNSTDQKFITDVIPELSANKITSDTFHVDRIPTLAKSKISSTGTWNTSDIPDLSTTYLTAVSADTSPQLGGNFDVNGNSIVSTSNGNVTLNPNGTGVVSFANNTGTTYVNGSYGVTIKPPTLSANLSLVLPATDGTDGQYLKTDGSGNLGWAAETTYSLAGADDSGDFRIRLTDGTSNDDVKLKAGTGVSLDNSTANECTISVSAVPTGAIMWWTNTTIPTGWLECKGQALLRTDYSALVLQLGSTFSAHRDVNTFPLATYPETDYFTLPDLRGQFIRGLDTAGTTDEDARTLGQEQADQFQGHYHSASTTADVTSTNQDVGTSNPIGGAAARDQSDGTVSVAQPTTGGNGTVRYGNETRPRNIAMIAIIKT